MPGASGRVLVVDDNKVIRQLIRVNLELEGLEVVTAADGVECLDLVHDVRPDVVTLDVVMPRLDGLRTAARLRSDPRTRDLPLAIVSACTAFEVEAGLDVGVDAFLAKPFEPAELVRLVQQLIEGKGGTRGGRSRGGGEGEGGAGRHDAGLRDGVLRDTGFRDSGPRDAPLRDAGHPDAGLRDAGLRDAGHPDAGLRDAGLNDDGLHDPGLQDAGHP